MSQSDNKRVASWDSESEPSDFGEQPPPQPAKKAKKSAKAETPSATSKSKKKTSTSGTTKSAKSLSSELFGDDSDGPCPEPVPKASPLWSSLARRVADGVTRQVELVEEGEIFFDVKVFNNCDIIDLDPRQRAEKWTAQLRLRVKPNDPLWVQLKKIARDAKRRFHKDPIFYKNK
ncbi:uncharacterized protein LOC135074776 [Ostrinia nubilalis]|uniref:uncharacterized protein LOC135074776 n=1 Tax=Ostrinia nubilalis TaxID=29057 RepID=UPI0030825C67